MSSGPGIYNSATSGDKCVHLEAKHEGIFFPSTQGKGRALDGTGIKSHDAKSGESRIRYASSELTILRKKKKYEEPDTNGEPCSTGG